MQSIATGRPCSWRANDGAVRGAPRHVGAGRPRVLSVGCRPGTFCSPPTAAARDFPAATASNIVPTWEQVKAAAQLASSMPASRVVRQQSAAVRPATMLTAAPTRNPTDAAPRTLSIAGNGRSLVYEPHGDPQDDELEWVRADVAAQAQSQLAASMPTVDEDEEEAAVRHQEHARLRLALRLIHVASYTPSPSPDHPESIGTTTAEDDTPLAAAAAEMPARFSPPPVLAAEAEQDGCAAPWTGQPCVLDPEVAVVESPEDFGEPQDLSEVLHQVHAGDSLRALELDDSHGIEQPYV